MRNHASLVIICLALCGALLIGYATYGSKDAATQRAKLTTVTPIFSALFSGQAVGRTTLADAGLALTQVNGEAHVGPLGEATGHCSNLGQYRIRRGKGISLVISAPHGESDLHTRALATAFFDETGAAGLALNSAPRRKDNTCPKAIDLADTRDHPFSAFALAFANSAPDGTLIQLHGFDNAKRSSLSAQTAGVIVSNGTSQPNAPLLDLADCLSLVLAPVRVLVFPSETQELGGVSNAQGILLQEAGFAHFVHLEISADLRRRMIDDHVLRGQFATCFAEAAA